VKRSKKQRRLEAEQEAAIARFWVGQIKTADRLGCQKPVNRQASKELSKPKKRKRRR
jgi:hypothetical protein